MEGVELEKYHAEMKQKQMDIPKCKEKKTGGRNVSEKPTEKQQQAGTSSEVMVH